MHTSLFCLLLTSLLLVMASGRPLAADDNPFVFIAGYDSTVICYEFNSATGEMKELSRSDCGANPTYMAWHPSRKFMYAANEIGAKKGEVGPKGLVSAYSIDPKNGKLTKLNEVSSGGAGPCHVIVHPDGKWVFTGNYGSGHIGIAPIKEDGSLGTPLEAILGGKNAHQVVIDATGKFIFVPFLGSNHINQYKFDEVTGKLTPNDPPFAPASAEKAGPRHMAFHPSMKFAYVIEEQGLRVDSFDYDKSKGLLSNPQGIPTVPDDTKDRNKKSTAHIVVSPDGKFVYGSNRGEDTIVIYSVDKESGRLTLVGYENGGGAVKIPRDFALDLTGKFAIVASQIDAGIVIVFKRNEATGKLEKIGTYDVAKKPAFVGVMAKP